MNKLLERQIQKKVADYAKSKGFYAKKLATTNAKGFPDYIFIYKGLISFVEFKSSTGELSELQKREIQILRSHGAKVEVINDVEEGKLFIDREKT